MISVHCWLCKRELDQPGAIILGPPDGLEVLKFHICVSCFDRAQAGLTDLMSVTPGWVDIDCDTSDCVRGSRPVHALNHFDRPHGSSLGMCSYTEWGDATDKPVLREWTFEHSCRHMVPAP